MSAISSIFSHLNPLDSDFAVEVVNLLLPMAVSSGASDVHLQPRADGWEVLVRIDGVLSVVDWIRGGGSANPVTRLMVMSGLPTYRSGQPMEGRLKWATTDSANRHDVSLRLSVYPTIHGPRAVIRLLRKDDQYDSLESLGLATEVTETLARLTKQTDGAVLLSGPSGSGKTTTLYAMLRRIALAVPRRSVVTIEDPVESVIDLISQSELDPAGGMTLASALRSAVRQDSEVLLVSEIRDPETAEAAMQASLTGHLVFSSLHATDIPSCLRRLVQLGVPAYALRSGLRAVLTQRLLRRRCETCKADTASESKPNQSCPDCIGSGYKHRVAIASCVRFDGSDPVGEALADELQRDASVNRLRQVAKEAGDVDLRATAMQLVEHGVTDAAEVYRVLGA